MTKRLQLLSIMLCLSAISQPAQGGSGKINADGTIDLTVYFPFFPSAKERAEAYTMISDASELLWNATEGQLRIGKVTFTDAIQDEGLADVRLTRELGRSWANIDGLEVHGGHTLIHRPWPGPTLAHELGHLALGLWDEYAERFESVDQWGFPICSGQGQCIDDEHIDDVNNCIMQSLSATEFCTAQNHDLLQGDEQNCPLCQSLMCPGWDSGTLNWETTVQQARNGCDCWTHIASRLDFLVPPAGLPSSTPPAGFTPPVVIDEIGFSEHAILVLDRSGSMAWNSADDWGEVCSNGRDDDGDGQVDELDDCTEPRISFVKASARAFLHLAEANGSRVGIVSFATSASLDESIRLVDQASIGDLINTSDSIAPSGATALGDALDLAIQNLNEIKDGKRSIFVITDGVSNVGKDPVDVVAESLEGSGICVHSVSTGAASDSETLSQIASMACGGRLDARNAASLVSTIALQWAIRNGEELLAPVLPFRIKSEYGWGNDPLEWDREYSIDDWLQGTGNIQAFAIQRFALDVPEGAMGLTIVAAGQMAPLVGFGLEATLIDPNGASYSTYAGDVEAVTDPFFAIFRLPVTISGEWTLEITGKPGSNLLQHGEISIIANGTPSLVTSVLPSLVTDPISEEVEIRSFVNHGHPVIGMDSVSAVLQLFDGTNQAVPLNWERGRWSFDASLHQLPFTGLYTLRTAARSGMEATTYGGESLFSTEPNREEHVFPFALGYVNTFWVSNGELDPRPEHRQEVP